MRWWAWCISGPSDGRSFPKGDPFDHPSNHTEQTVLHRSDRGSWELLDWTTAFRQPDSLASKARIIEVIRGDELIGVALNEIVFEAGDRVRMSTVLSSVMELKDLSGLEIQQQDGLDGLEWVGTQKGSPCGVRGQSALFDDGQDNCPGRSSKGLWCACPRRASPRCQSQGEAAIHRAAVWRYLASGGD